MARDAEYELRADKLLAVLADHEVRYVLIGGYAAIAYGSPFPTEDIDITPARDMENLARLSSALTDLGARIRAREVPGGLPFGHDAESLAASSIWNLETRFGDLDISFVPNGTDGYDDLIKDAQKFEVASILVETASLADIIRSKQAADRDKDKRVLPTLRRILAERWDERC